MRQIYVNEAFRGQRVSGQQRYAGEISDRLPADWIRLRPTGVWAAHKLLTWLWVQTVLPWKSRDGVLVSMTARVPLWHPRHVVVIHDFFVIEHPEWFSRSYYLTHKPLQLLTTRSAKALVAVSEPTAASLRSQRISAPVLVAPNAPSAVFSSAKASSAKASSADVKGAAPAILAQHDLTEGRFFVTVGSLEPRKNLRTLAEAYAQLDDATREQWPLVVVGAPADVFASAEVRWPTGTRVVGYVSDEELRDLYRASAAVVFVSLAEGFGLPLVEATDAGAPRIIASDIEVFRWICADAASYVDPTDAHAIAAALITVTSGELPPSRADVSRFTWDSSAVTVADAARIAAGDDSPVTVTGDATTAGAPATPGAHDGEVGIVIASAGRPDLLRELLTDLARQSVPARIALCVPDEESLPTGGAPDGVAVTFARGAAAQRNAAMTLIPDAEYLFVFDDDSVVRDDYLERALAFFDAHPRVVALTGSVIIDGATTAEIPREEADRALEASRTEPGTSPGSDRWHRGRELYGCNFAFRRSALDDPAEAFDSRLPLYSWLEDHDLARRLMRHGLLAKVEDCVIVHRGVKSGGRTSHVRLGYSQMMNPFYLHHKGSFPMWLVLREMGRPVLKNVALSISGQEAPFRRQRLQGNLLAAKDLLAGRHTPERILDL